MPTTQALAPRDSGVARTSESPAMSPPGAGGHAVSCQLKRDPAQVRHAREHARETLSGWGLGEHADLAELVVSELATNAIRHGEGPVEVRLSYVGCDLRVEVHDAGASRPVRRPATPDDESGRGLALLDGLIAVYGGTRGITDDGAGCGKTVYVVLTLEITPAGAR